MKRKFEEDFPKDGEDLDLIPEEPDLEEKQTEKTEYENTVELTNKGFTQELVQQMNKNQLKIAKIKLKKLIKEKKQIKQYIKQNLQTKGVKGLIETKEEE